MQRIRQKSSGTYGLSVDTTSEAGAAVTTVAPVSVAVADGAGAVTLAGGVPTPVAGKLTYAAALANLPELDTYSVLWTGTIGAETLEWPTVVEICGGYFFELAQLRALDDALASLPAELLTYGRLIAEKTIEAAARTAFVPRCARETVWGSGAARLRLRHPAIRTIRSVSVDDVALTAGELDALIPREWGALDLRSGHVWTRDAKVVVTYEHGEDAPPEQLAAQAMVLAIDVITPVASGLPSRATSQSVGDQTYRITIAGRDGRTGIPTVDEAIREATRRTHLVS